MAFAVGADTVPVQEFNGFLPCPFFRAPCCFLPFVNNNYLLISSMPKRSSSATVKEQRIIKKARERPRRNGPFGQFNGRDSTSRQQYKIYRNQQGLAESKSSSNC
ncbi:unnamed protein product [Meloidogyne enterolobii]|uniref:Uncharacterized protein n=1 Tax=Meloidogyne enterolobii TaxID=390850 RepID=A0ACB0Y786_MELEN